MNTNPVIANNTLDVDLFFKTVDEMILAESNRGQTVFGEYRDKVVFCLMYGLGLRLSDLLNLDVDDVHEVSSESIPFKGIMELCIYSDSSKKVRHVLVYRQNLSAMLDWYLNEVRPSLNEEYSQDDDALFIGSAGNRLQDSSLKYHFEQILEHAGLDRQTYTIDALRKEGLAAMKAGQKALNRFTMNCFHNYPTTTEGYNPSDPILRALADAHRKAIEHDCSDDNHAAVEGEESSQ